ncbi:MAG: transglutaminase-like domain-containing protein [Candidatus Latescibacter sp.]|nr:transglutaminase-like domain-containing protein [Candidatus Latescibacter sp.]
MLPRKTLVWSLYLFAALSMFLFAASLAIFVKSFQDPRWRVFDYNSRQTVEDEIYNVSEIPAIKAVKLIGNRTLRFEFTPAINTTLWKILDAADKKVISQGPYPDITFSDKPSDITYLFVPEGVTLLKGMALTLSYYPKEGYRKGGLSWPDNYWKPYSSIPFSLKRHFSLNEWAGLPDNDPDLIEAKIILGNAVDANAPTREKVEHVFRFVMNGIKNSGGMPTDEVLNSSPMKTYRMLSGGTGKGFCENRALVYYLFANAAGIKTRLVDIAGKFGPLKLTGHYFCESWIPEQASWCFVDPMSSAAYIQNAKGKLLNTLEIKKLFDLDAFAGCSTETYISSVDSLSLNPIDAFYHANKGYFTGEIVMAYQFGYPRNKTFSRVEHFLRYPTLLYAPFALPRLYLVKNAVLAGCAVSFLVTIILALSLLAPGSKKSSGS